MIDPALRKMKTIISRFRRNFFSKTIPVSGTEAENWGGELCFGYHQPCKSSPKGSEILVLRIKRRGLTWLSVKVWITAPDSECTYKRYFYIDELLNALDPTIQTIKSLLTCPSFPPPCPRDWWYKMGISDIVPRLAHPEEILSEEEKGIRKILDWVYQQILAAGYIRSPNRRAFVANKSDDDTVTIRRLTYSTFEYVNRITLYIKEVSLTELVALVTEHFPS